ncbi:sugar ABC transporter ATP-binding protein, partial [Mesorhizobium sp. B1-1-5]|uniref:sugar ABC transporter ATP-binding protein n=1 Tax=Mesorhizobium sp. B1-1-5 TaxID=2589979 RepID=UPI00112DC3E1
MSQANGHDVILKLEDVSKVYAGTVAVKQANFEVRKGAVNVLVGENGAGKSTLMKIIAGVEQPTVGRILLEGEEVSFSSSGDAVDRGIGMVFQELNLFGNLSVAENIFATREITNRFRKIDRKEQERRAGEFLERLEAGIRPDMLVEDLRIGQQQLVEIAKAYAAQPRIIVLDEPTSSLSEHETAALFRILRKMRDDGIAIVYISHRLKEVLEIADEVTVLRDGSMIETRPIDGITAAEMIRLMVGREVANVFPKSPAAIGKSVLRVERIGDGAHFRDVSFDVRAGEILGLTGLVGAGRTEVARAIFGLSRLVEGTVSVYGRKVAINSPSEAVRAGIAYVPEDRKGDGIIPGMSVRENISLSILRRLTSFGRIRRSADRSLATTYVK